MSLCKCQPCLVEPQSLKLNLSRSSAYSFKPSDSDSDIRYQKSQIQENQFNSFSTSTTNKDIETSGHWSFLLALNNTSDRTQKSNSTEIDKVYIHPLAKRSSSILSQKSLEMCTENLGSETGCDMSMNESYNNDIALPTKLKSTENGAPKRLKRTISSFPPPLSSITNSSNLQMTPHREDGRLVLTAVTGWSSYFEAERCDGRLKLTLFDSSYNEVETEEELEEEEEEEEEEKKEEDGVLEITEGEEKGEENEREDKEVNNENEEGEMGIEKIKKLIFRSKKGGRGNKKKVTMNWEQFWVAT